MKNHPNTTMHGNDSAPRHISLGNLAVGFLALAMAITAVLIGRQLKAQYPFAHNFHDKIDSPVLAIELSACAKDQQAILGTDHPAQVDPNTPSGKAIECLRSNTYEDFFFIPLYTIFLWGFASRFTTEPHGRRVAHSRTIAVIAILTAIFDCAENFGILRTLKASSLSDAGARATYLPSMCKWFFFGMVLLLTAWILARSSSEVYSLPTRRLLVLAYGSAGVLLLIGLAMPHVIETATNMFGLLVAVNIVGLLGTCFENTFLQPRIPVYVEDFCNRRAELGDRTAVSPGVPGAMR
jgi:hypothetical protein